ncbi:hypothetical protein E1B28_001962 [Marasmius oreades]|uniref:DNA damage-responsive protein 48 n=1 Tax=Marasmius oreades TaxID=181124 RepID=A0A9P8AGE5_9AGAR|nr:uncharacterized protein E1B28_001962 [Marasmius oreades]KAG7100185.1 hypothetical protein E1B28_001962 [Marasmius oreades]
MDFLNKNNDNSQSQQPQQATGQGAGAPAGSGGGIMGKFNNALGGGASGEKKEDALDKGVDYVQEHVFKQGPQTNESAAEQTKDEAISDSIRNQYKNMSGKDFPVADK